LVSSLGRLLLFPVYTALAVIGLISTRTHVVATLPSPFVARGIGHSGRPHHAVARPPLPR